VGQNLSTETAPCEANLSRRTTEKHVHNEMKGKNSKQRPSRCKQKQRRGHQQRKEAKGRQENEEHLTGRKRKKQDRNRRSRNLEKEGKAKWQERLSGVYFDDGFFCFVFFSFAAVPLVAVHVTSPEKPRKLHALGPRGDQRKSQEALCKARCATPG
jgi:hypothetical protein